jgi:hypothetical protein
MLVAFISGPPNLSCRFIARKSQSGMRNDGRTFHPAKLGVGGISRIFLGPTFALRRATKTRISALSSLSGATFFAVDKLHAGPFLMCVYVRWAKLEMTSVRLLIN